ncbi:hypothetical protein LZQ00_00720 [Sphingobacterium sp. SRCM116780]|uniref:hypothetical protein n=1 Tax=Sphingobacterium sp. SRCM116780 TaxID=2907623 RepID=UPI001F288C65|nr:hypothetical protein [Sphingobacterium sp. SRCM116780]UIR56365.1 hypothetical protein LZQ00_00720 [Sphingobacterium sp. SRCM116780]
MGLAGILNLGYKIKNIDDLSEEKYHVFTGVIVAFKYKEDFYRYFEARDFRKGDYQKQVVLNKDNGDEKVHTVTAGFYVEKEFLKYLSGELDHATLITKQKFDIDVLSDAIISKDTIKLVRANTEPPYKKEFESQEVTWLYQGESVYDENDGQLVIPESAKKEPVSYELGDTARSYYANNIDVVTRSLNIKSSERGQAVGILASIALVIDQIEQSIFPILNKNNAFNEFIVSQSNYWKNELIHTETSLEMLSAYKTNFDSFFETVYKNQLYLNSNSEKNALLLFGHILSESALRIVPLNKRLEILKVIVDERVEIVGITLDDAVQGEVRTAFGGINREAIVIKIVRTIQTGEENLFLNELAKAQTSDRETLFELLYKGIENSHFLVGVNNLDGFMNEMYKVWLRSSYNPNNLLSDDDIIGKEDNKPISINYKTSTAWLFFNDTNYSFEFDKSQIVVKLDDDTETHKEEAFHMFRCILLMGTESISGDQQIMEIYINGQQEMAIPLFYLKYIDDKKVTDNIKTGIQIGVDIALTLIPLANLTKLRYILQLTKFGRAITGRLAVTEAEAVLLRLELSHGFAAAVEITAGLASIYYNYAKQVEEVCEVTNSKYDQDKCKYYQKMADLFMYIGLVGGVLDFVAARKVKNVAKQILDSPLANTLDPDISKILRRFAAPLGESVEATNTFWTYVRDPKNSKLFSEEFKLWWEKAENWTDTLRAKFVEDFGYDVARLERFKTPEMMNGWKIMATRDIPLSNNIKFLENTDVANRLVSLYDDINLKNVYKALIESQAPPESITAFLKTFDDIGAAYYTKFADDVTLVKSWFRYYDEPVLSSIFLQLKKDGTLKFVERYGKCSDEGFNMIKSNAKVHIDRLLEYPDATHHIDYFNNRRAEMLPPNFKDMATNQFYRLHETDSFIEIELKYGGKAKGSLINEAGDIIMQGGTLNSQSLDPLGIKFDLPQKLLQQQDINRFYNNWLGEYIPNNKSTGFLGSIDKHFKKINNPDVGKPPLDKVVIDYKYLDEISAAIGQSSDYLKIQIDQFILTNFNQYNNDNFLIKLNY